MAERMKWLQVKENNKKYYSLKNILETGADYNIILGERSNGKSYATLDYILKRYFKNGEEGFYIRRHHSDVVRAQCVQTWSGHIDHGLVEKYSNGMWNDVVYKPMKHCWCFRNIDMNGKIVEADEPFCYCTSLEDAESFKGGQYPNVKNILFDELIPMHGNSFLYEEWSLFQNVISTIIRDRGDIKIFMVGNTISPHGNPYFRNMGLNHIKQMEAGTIDVYTFADGKSIAVEYTMPYKDGKESDRYFAFDNPDTMIINGAWALSCYPQRDKEWGRIRPCDILFTYFIIYEDEILQCEIIKQDIGIYTYIHKRTKPIPEDDKRLVFSLEYTPKPNYHRRLSKPMYPIDAKLFSFFQRDRVFYQDNSIGDLVENYLAEASK